MNVACGKEGNAIYCNMSHGPRFGGGHDIFISDNSNVSNKNFSNFGYDYVLDEYPYESEQANSFLAGSWNFTVEEIEVFQLK